MKLAFNNLQECLSSFEIIDSGNDENYDLNTCVIFKNVRSFKNWNIAPLKDLNILTGPNSSGKSTLANIISNLNASKFKKFIQSLAENNKNPTYVGISMHWSDFENLNNDPISYSSSISYFKLFKIVEIMDKNIIKLSTNIPKRITIIAESKGEDWDLDLYAFIDNELIGFLSIGNNDGMDEDEIYFKISNHFWNKLFNLEYSKKLNNELSITPVLKKSFDKRKLNKEITGGQTIDCPPYFFQIKSYEDFNFRDGPDIQFGVTIDDVYQIEYAMVCLYILFFKPFRIFEDLSGEILPSLRPISSSSELQYKFEIGFKGNKNIGNLKNNSHNTALSFKNLAEVIAKEKLNLFTYVNGIKNFNEVNKWLKEILSDSHKLAFRYNEVVIKDKKHPWATEFKWRGAHVKNVFIDFFLLDSSKNELGFGDVGTGISQVLPVISSIINADHSVFLQPELHLHPKAQAKLGDLFIHALNNSKINVAARNFKYTIETHSEHLILRLLRRIKENSDNTSKNIFSNKNLSLIYVNPSINGSEIHWIRIDKKGDFIDVWPNGFFEDRYEDIFFTNK